MTDEQTPVTENAPTRKIGVTFSRKLTDGNYGGNEASAWVEGNVASDADAQTVATAIANLFTGAKAAVLDELGVEWHIDPETGHIRETVTPYVSTQHAQAGAQRAMGGQMQDNNQQQSGLRIMNAGKPGVSTDPIPDWVISQAQRDGVTAVWDERLANAGTNKPLFKEAVARGGVGHGKDGQAKGYWPPR